MDERKRSARRRFPRWSEEEDAELRQICAGRQKVPWAALELRFQGRSAKQIRERWLNQVDPRVSRQHWSPSEDWRLFLLQSTFGSRWSVFRAHFPRRSDNQLKNRWNSAVRPKLAALNSKLEQLLESGAVEVGVESALLRIIAERRREERAATLQLVTPCKLAKGEGGGSAQVTDGKLADSSRFKLSYAKCFHETIYLADPRSSPDGSPASTPLPALDLSPYLI